MEDEECIHGMYPITSCTICNGKDKKAAMEPRTFKASYAGTCTNCYGRIEIGDMILWHPMRQGVFCGESCWDDFNEV